MMTASFKDDFDAKRYGVPYEAKGVVVANEMRDGGAFVSVLFQEVEVNGLPADMFTFEEVEEGE